MDNRNKRGPGAAHWKGGMVLNYHGYIRLYIGRDHPWADKQGYILEHRFIVGQQMGRNLRASEVVHHKDHDRANNDPNNLEYCPSSRSHIAKHRKRTDLRPVGAINPSVKCACGCGEEFLRYDEANRPRRYSLGHGVVMVPSPTQDLVQRCLNYQWGKSAVIIAEETRKTVMAVKSALTKLRKAGIANPTESGWVLLSALIPELTNEIVEEAIRSRDA